MPFATLTLKPRMRKFAKVRYAAGVCIALMLLSGCGGVSTRDEVDSAARSLLAQQRYAEAGDEYLRLASQSRPPASHQYLIKAAAALVDGGDVAAARSVLSDRLPLALAEEIAIARDVVLARASLAERDPFSALELLTPGLEGRAPTTLHALIFEYRALALAGLGRHLDAARERVALTPLLSSEARIEANHRALWASISQLSPQELSLAATSAAGALAGWLDLAILSHQLMTDPDALSRGLQAWRLQFPGHPAESLIVPELELFASVGPVRPERIALMLPLRGPFATAAAAIRDGFLSAWIEDGNDDARPSITVVDSTDAEILSLYRQTVDQGAQFVVGPLDRSAVTVLAAEPGLPVTTLALNYAEDPPATGSGSIATGSPYPPSPTATPTDSPGEADGTIAQAVPLSATSSIVPSALLYQFALSPEGEAAAVAERAWLDGHRRAGVLAVDTSLGERIAGGFNARWETLGGVLATHRRYADDARDLSEPVADLLNLERSRERFRRLGDSIGGGVRHEPRQRQDLDVLVVIGSPLQVRLVKPQLDYFGAGHISLYSTSHVFSAVVDPIRDSDLDGVRFGDMPWVFPDTNQDVGLRARVSSAWPDAPPALTRLHAFGIDAYRLVPQLGRLRAQPFSQLPGATGDLAVQDDNRVVRKLRWAEFREGRPVLVGVDGLTP